MPRVTYMSFKTTSSLYYRYFYFFSYLCANDVNLTSKLLLGKSGNDNFTFIAYESIFFWPFIPSRSLPSRTIMDILFLVFR